MALFLACIYLAGPFLFYCIADGAGWCIFLPGLITEQARNQGAPSNLSKQGEVSNMSGDPLSEDSVKHHILQLLLSQMSNKAENLLLHSSVTVPLR